jgi:hypothetical protein
MSQLGSAQYEEVLGFKASSSRLRGYDLSIKLVTAKYCFLSSTGDQTTLNMMNLDIQFLTTKSNTRWHQPAKVKSRL